MSTEIYLIASDAAEDAPLIRALRTHLEPTLRRCRVILWDATQIAPGDHRHATRQSHLQRAAVVLLALSPESLVERADEIAVALTLDKTRVVPLLLRPCGYASDSRIAALQPLPRGGAALSILPDRDDALTAITKEIEALLPIKGALPGSYASHPVVEQEARRRLAEPRSPVVIQGPWRFGKGTLIGRLTEGAGGRVVRLDLAALYEEEREAFETLDGLLLLLARRLLIGLGLPPGGDPEAFALLAWKRPSSPKGKLAWLLEQHVLPACDLLYLSLERAERVDGRSYQSDFFVMLRSWVENLRSPWERLRLLVSVSTEPMHLESPEHSSFFLRAPPIQLPALDRSQISTLATQSGFDPAHPALDRLFERTSGHPELVYQFLWDAARRGSPLRESDPEDGVFEAHLKWLRLYVERNGLLVSLCRGLRGETLPWDEYCRLYQPGLLVEEPNNPGTYLPRCPVYADYFGKLCRR